MCDFKMAQELQQYSLLFRRYRHFMLRIIFKIILYFGWCIRRQTALNLPLVSQQTKEKTLSVWKTRGKSKIVIWL